MKSKYLSLTAILTLLLLLDSVSSLSQSVQAIRGISSGKPTERETEVKRREDEKLLVAQKLGYFNAIVNDTAFTRIKPNILVTIKEANEVIGTAIPDNFEAFDKELNEYNIAEGILRSTALIAPIIELNIPEPAAEIAGQPVPGSSILVPDIVFSIGPEINTFSNRSVWSFGISSNLLGAVVGSAFDALGSTALKNYFTDNISIGTAIPFGQLGNLTSQLGLGLGGINIRKIMLWPVLHIEQLNANDVRLPTGLNIINPDAKNWSSPLFSIAILPFSKEKVQDRLQQGKLVPIPVFGLRLPFYYPGSHFSSLGALFTDDRANYERRGGVQFLFGITFPLLKIKQ